MRATERRDYKNRLRLPCPDSKPITFNLEPAIDFPGVSRTVNFQLVTFNRDVLVPTFIIHQFL
jgi:hypothetical protein